MAPYWNYLHRVAYLSAGIGVGRYLPSPSCASWRPSLTTSNVTGNAWRFSASHVRMPPRFRRTCLRRDVHQLVRRSSSST